MTFCIFQFVLEKLCLISVPGSDNESGFATQESRGAGLLLVVLHQPFSHFIRDTFFVLYDQKLP